MYGIDLITGRCMLNWNHLQSRFKDIDLVSVSQCNIKKVAIIFV